MLPQHGKVPRSNMKISGPFLAALTLVLVTGLLLTLSFHLSGESGDLAAKNRTTLTLIVTLMLSGFILLAGTGRWWHRHLWQNGNSQKHHRHRHRHDPPARQRRDSSEQHRHQRKI